VKDATESGEVTVRGYRSIPVDQLWFFTPEWQRKEQEADQELASTEPTETFADGDAFIRALMASRSQSGDSHLRIQDDELSVRCAQCNTALPF
jgi:hypothetical protein